MQHAAAQQGNGMAGIQEATQMVTSYFDPATKLIYAIGAVIGLIGAVILVTAIGKVLLRINQTALRRA